MLARDKHSSLFRQEHRRRRKKVLQLQQQEAQRILVPHKPNHLRYLAALRATRGSNSDPADEGKVSITPSYSLDQLDYLLIGSLPTVVMAKLIIRKLLLSRINRIYF